MTQVLSRLISLQVGASGASGTPDVSDQVSSFTVDSAATDSNFLSLAGQRSGGRTYTVSMTIVQDYAPGSLWSLIWSNPGGYATGVYTPYGSATSPSTSTPRLAFTAIIAEPDGTLFGGQSSAAADNLLTCDVTWTLTGRPTLLTS